MKFRGNVEFVEERLRFALRFPAAQFRKLAFELGGADPVLFGKIRVSIESVFLVHDFD